MTKVGTLSQNRMSAETAKLSRTGFEDRSLAYWECLCISLRSQHRNNHFEEIQSFQNRFEQAECNPGITIWALHGSTHHFFSPFVCQNGFETIREVYHSFLSKYFDFKIHWYQFMPSKTRLDTKGFIVVRMPKCLFIFKISYEGYGPSIFVTWARNVDSSAFLSGGNRVSTHNGHSQWGPRQREVEKPFRRPW